jgi:hypothetical protein
MLPALLWPVIFAKGKHRLRLRPIGSDPQKNSDNKETIKSNQNCSDIKQVAANGCHTRN